MFFPPGAGLFAWGFESPSNRGDILTDTIERDDEPNRERDRNGPSEQHYEH